MRGYEGDLYRVPVRLRPDKIEYSDRLRYCEMQYKRRCRTKRHHCFSPWKRRVLRRTTCLSRSRPSRIWRYFRRFRHWVSFPQGLRSRGLRPRRYFHQLSLRGRPNSAISLRGRRQGFRIQRSHRQQCPYNRGLRSG